MALTILYVFSTILLFTGIEPFQSAGVLFSICFLPGLLVFSFSKKDRLSYEDLVLACACSIGISSILVLLLLSSGMPVRTVLFVMHGGMGVAMLVRIIKKKTTRAFPVVDVKSKELMFSLFALVVTVLLSIPSLLGPRYGIASHAFLHSSIISQILNGIFPPENPGLGGTPLWYYWGFHTLIAAVTAHSGLQQIQIMFLLNILALYLLFCFSYIFAEAFSLSESYRYILPLAVIGLMRSDAGIVSLTRLISGNVAPVDNIVTPPFHVYPFDIMKNWSGDLPLFDSRMYFLNKYYNVSGMPVAISLCLAYFYLLFKVMDKKPSGHKIYSYCIAVIIAACFINYPPLAFVPLFHAPVWAIYIFLSGDGELREKLKESSRVLIPYTVSLLAVTPYLLMISKGGADDGKVIRLAFYSQSLKNSIVFLLPLPLIISGAWIAVKRSISSRETYFLLIGTLMCLGLSIFTRLPLDNSYKFNFILTFFLALYFVFALSSLLPLISHHWIRRSVAAGLISYLLLTPVMTEASYIASSVFSSQNYIFSEKHIFHAENDQRDKAYVWIHENTPANALIMLSYIETSQPCCGLSANYEESAVAERSLYVIKDTDFTVKNKEYERRVWFRERLFDDPDDPGVLNYFASLGRPVYLLIDGNLPQHKFYVQNRFKEFSENPGQEFLLVYRNAEQRIYLIKSTI